MRGGAAQRGGRAPPWCGAMRRTKFETWRANSQTQGVRFGCAPCAPHARPALPRAMRRPTPGCPVLRAPRAALRIPRCATLPCAAACPRAPHIRHAPCYRRPVPTAPCSPCAPSPAPFGRCAHRPARCQVAMRHLAPPCAAFRHLALPGVVSPRAAPRHFGLSCAALPQPTSATRRLALHGANKCNILISINYSYYCLLLLLSVFP